MEYRYARGCAALKFSGILIAALMLALTGTWRISAQEATPTAASEALVRLVHASPDAPAVDVAVTGGDVIFLNAAFRQATENLEIEGGTYDLDVRPTRTTDVVLLLPGGTLEAGTVYSIYAIGQLGDDSLDVLVLTAPMAGAGEATPEANSTPEA